MMEGMASEAYRRVFNDLISKSFEAKYKFKFDDMLTELRESTDMKDCKIPDDIELAIVALSPLSDKATLQDYRNTQGGWDPYIKVELEMRRHGSLFSQGCFLVTMGLLHCNKCCKCAEKLQVPFLDGQQPVHNLAAEGDVIDVRQDSQMYTIGGKATLFIKINATSSKHSGHVKIVFRSCGVSVESAPVFVKTKI